MIDNYRTYNNYYKSEKQRHSYDIYPYDTYYMDGHKKRINSKQGWKQFSIRGKDKHLKEREVKTREFNDYSTMINKRSIWGSRPFYQSGFTIRSNNRNSYKGQNNISLISKEERKRNRKIRKRNLILKCLLEFNRSRREVEAKFFDIWFDKTYYYYDYDYDLPQKSKQKYIDSDYYYDLPKYEKEYKKSKKKIKDKISKKKDKKEKYYISYNPDNSYNTYNHTSFSYDKDLNYSTISKENALNKNKKNNKERNKPKTRTREKERKNKKDIYYSDFKKEDESNQDTLMVFINKVQRKTKNNKRFI